MAQLVGGAGAVTVSWFEVRDRKGNVLLWMEASADDKAPVTIAGPAGGNFQRFALSYVNTYGLSVRGIASTVRAHSTGLFTSVGPPPDGVTRYRVDEGVSQSHVTARHRGTHERLRGV